MKREFSRGGIISALVTPYRPDGAVNLAMVGRLVEAQIGQGVEGFYVGGSTGESLMQSIDERSMVIRAAAEAGRKSAQLIAHVGSIATEDCLALARVAASSGYDAISAIPPFYYDFSREELVGHYHRLAEATPLPLIIYNFVGKTGRLTADDLLRLLDHPGVAGVKHTSQDFYLMERFKQRRPDAVIYNGFDEMCLAGLAMGADGAIGTTYNFMGGLFVALRNAFDRNEMAEALALQKRANRIIDLLIELGVFPATKAILKLQGFDCGACRAPFRSLTAAEEERLRHAVVEHLGEKTRA